MRVPTLALLAVLFLGFVAGDVRGQPQEADVAKDGRDADNQEEDVLEENLLDRDGELLHRDLQNRQRGMMRRWNNNYADDDFYFAGNQRQQMRMKRRMMTKSKSKSKSKAKRETFSPTFFPTFIAPPLIVTRFPTFNPRPPGSELPTVKGATTGPTVKGATTGPTVKGATTGPTVKGATTGPTVKGATTGPTVKGATTGPTVKGATTGPTVKAATTGPTVKAATGAPTPKQSAATA